MEGEGSVYLGSRAIDILIALTERPGELVSKKELMARVWPNVTVVEGNLTVHVAALRRALRDGRDGARYLVNIPGQGYRFVAPVTIVPAAMPSAYPRPPDWRCSAPGDTGPLKPEDEISMIRTSLLVLSAVASVLGFELRAGDGATGVGGREIRLLLSDGACRGGSERGGRRLARLEQAGLAETIIPIAQSRPVLPGAQ